MTTLNAIHALSQLSYSPETIQNSELRTENSELWYKIRKNRGFCKINRFECCSGSGLQFPTRQFRIN